MNNLRKIFVQVTLLTLVAALSSSCSAEAKKNRALRRAEEYFKAGDYDKAKLEYTNVLRADPKDPEPFLKIGTIWLDEGAPLRAGPFLIRGKELAPARAEMRTKLAEVYIGVAGLPEARKEAIEALKLEPGNLDALLVLADSARSKEEIAQ
ncbi:MAG: tetratricopeptide repeat protein, partial [Chthoniobacterales bacterium]